LKYIKVCPGLGISSLFLNVGASLRKPNTNGMISFNPITHAWRTIVLKKIYTNVWYMVVDVLDLLQTIASI
jgi:hypothetical protein